MTPRFSEKMGDTKDMVTFHDIKRSYPPGEQMEVHYQIEAGSDLKTSKRDWVGLFRVGWTSSRDYYTFEWAPEPNPETNKGSVKFAGRRLPPEDGHFYQLCFVSRDGTVRGASAPFQFAPLSVCLEDMELVEITDDSMNSIMVLQKKSKEVESLRRESEEARSELEGVQSSLTAKQTENKALSIENAKLREQVEVTRKGCEDLQTELVALQAELEETRGKTEAVKKELEAEKQIKDARILNLEQQIAAKCKSEEHLAEQLSHEQERNKELLAIKENESEELKVWKERVSAIEGEVVVLTSDGEDLKQQIRIKESQVDDLRRLVATRGEELEQVSEKLKVSEMESAKLHALCAELRDSLQQREEEIVQQQGSFRVDINAALVQKDERIEKLEQELACSQANVAELIGAEQNERPQHRPPLPENMVDKGAYIALQQASETFEKYYKNEKVVKERLVIQMKTLQEENASLQSRYDTLVQRVKVCKSEYEAKAQECMKLQRQLKKEGIPTVVEPVKVGEMQQREQEEMIQNCQRAAEELSLQRKECDKRDTKIAQLEMELAQAIKSFEDLQDRFDKKIAEKNEIIERQKLVFEEKAAELAQVIESRDEQVARATELSEKIRKLQQREESSRSCPMCNMKFPLRMTEQDFERHVQSHFEPV